MNSINKYSLYEFKNDREGVLESVIKDGLSLQFAPDEFKNDRESVLESVIKDGLSLQFAPDEFKNDKKIVLEAVKNNGLSLKFASDELKNDKEIVSEAVKNNGLSLKYASYKLTDDEEIVWKSIKNNINSFEFASDELINNIDFVIKCVIVNKDITFYFEKNNMYVFNEVIPYIYSLQSPNMVPIFNTFFLTNIKYVSKIKRFIYILKHLLDNDKELVIENYEYFINIIDSKLKYIQIFQDYNIYFLKKEDVTSNDKFNFDDVKKIYEETHYKNKTIIWY